jgi:hypothetical protein
MMIKDKDLEFYENESIADPGIETERQEEIDNIQILPEQLLDRLDNANASSSPADSGGDVDADWEDVNSTGSEAVGGHNPTPDQSDVEENAHAMGIDFQDNEPLDFLRKMEKRDENRFELDESSKSGSDMI